MSDISKELIEIAERLASSSKNEKQSEISKSLERLEEAANQVGKAWSGSWIGYQSRVYYLGLQQPPTGIHFSLEWGLTTAFVRTTGAWKEYTFDDVSSAIFKLAGDPKLDPARERAEATRNLFKDSRAEVVSLLTTSLMDRQDSFLTQLKETAEDLKIVHANEIIQHLRPTQIMTRDRVAIDQGFQTPPHIAVIAEVNALQQPIHACEELARVAKQAASHIEKNEQYAHRSRDIGTNVFIGHGGSPLWKDLKGFISDRLGLHWDEFNRVPIAGISNTDRLSQMLNNAGVAFLVMTAEDEQKDGKIVARMNVIHEAGLFQGRLGFTRAIILREEGCEEFSNIHGLGQIPFPKGNIKAVFEEIRRVLEREGLISV